MVSLIVIGQIQAAMDTLLRVLDPECVSNVG